MICSYPYTGNFFSDGSSDLVRRMPEAVSRPATEAVTNFLAGAGVAVPPALAERTVAQVVRDLLGIQVRSGIFM